MKNIFVSQLIFLCFSAQIGANQIRFFNNGGEKGIVHYNASNLKGKLTSSKEKYDDVQLTASKEDIKETKPMIDALEKTSDEIFSVNHTYDMSGSEKNPKGFGVQVTALSSLNTVQDLYDELVKMGVKKEEIYVQVVAKDSMKIYRIICGEFLTKEGANEKLIWLSQHGYKGVIRSYNNL